jgi:hypothetical protein
MMNKDKMIKGVRIGPLKFNNVTNARFQKKKLTLHSNYKSTTNPKAALYLPYIAFTYFV